MIEYIITFQNSYISSYLFAKIITSIIEKGIEIHKLLHSNVFTVTFDYDDWPTNHYNDEKVIKSYNGSLFGLRDNYKNVFHEPGFEPMEDLAEDQFDATKIRKVSYSINLLMQSGMYIENGELMN